MDEEYFKYAKDKVYLKLYPKSILKLDELEGKKILDIGQVTEMIFYT
jgi:hypothetical protein